MKTKIEAFFKKCGLSLTDNNQFFSRKSEFLGDIEELRMEYNKIHRGKIYVQLCCQNAYNDFIIMLQIYYRILTGNPVKSKKK